MNFSSPFHPSLSSATSCPCFIQFSWHAKYECFSTPCVHKKLVLWEKKKQPLKPLMCLYHDRQSNFKAFYLQRRLFMMKEILEKNLLQIILPTLKHLRFLRWIWHTPNDSFKFAKSLLSLMNKVWRLQWFISIEAWFAGISHTAVSCCLIRSRTKLYVLNVFVRPFQEQEMRQKLLDNSCSRIFVANVTENKIITITIPILNYFYFSLVTMYYD